MIENFETFNVGLGYRNSDSDPMTFNKSFRSEGGSPSRKLRRQRHNSETLFRSLIWVRVSEDRGKLFLMKAHARGRS